MVLHICCQEHLPKGARAKFLCKFIVFGHNAVHHVTNIIFKGAFLQIYSS